MLARKLGMVIACFALCSLVLQVEGQQKDKKVEIPADAIVGTVKAVDMKAPNFTVTLKDGKDKTFVVTTKTEFWGPKGGDRGTGADGLKDDCMAKGYEIKIDATKDGKNAKNVYLPNRKTDAKADAPKKDETKKDNKK
jgi:hypothetical protein